MFKSALILFNVVFTLILNVIFGEGVKVTQNIPDKVNPGDEFVVELIVNKTDVSGFAKIQQELPEGFIAEAIETQGASFTFHDQKIKLIWMALPEADEFIIKYKATAGKEVNGTFDITGKFSYLYNNERKVIDLPINQIQVGEPPETEQLAEVAEETKEELTVTADRTIVQNGDNDFTITVKINHNGIVGFSKVQETLPEGVSSAEGIDTKHSVFSNVDNFAKFVWMSTPVEEEITISYNVKGDISADELKNMSGTYAYLDNEETKKAPISTAEVEEIEEPQEETPEEETPAEELLAKETQEETETTSESEVPTEVAIAMAAEQAAKEEAESNQETEPETSNQETSPVEEVVETVEEESIEEQQEIAETIEEVPTESITEKIEEPIKEEIVAETTVSTTKEESTTENESLPDQNETITASNKAEPTMTSTPSPQAGINFKVQICAGHEIVVVDQYFKKEYQFSEEKINTENHEGWIKYTIGSYNEYQSARDRRNVVTDGYSLPGPFVTAYNSGERITVQEALMIANQKWVK